MLISVTSVAHLVCLNSVANWRSNTFSATPPTSPLKELYRVRRRTGHYKPSSRISVSTVFLDTFRPCRSRTERPRRCPKVLLAASNAPRMASLISVRVSPRPVDGLPRRFGRSPSSPSRR